MKYIIVAPANKLTCLATPAIFGAVRDTNVRTCDLETEFLNRFENIAKENNKFLSFRFAIKLTLPLSKQHLIFTT